MVSSCCVTETSLGSSLQVHFECSAVDFMRNLPKQLALTGVPDVAWLMTKSKKNELDILYNKSNTLKQLTRYNRVAMHSATVAVKVTLSIPNMIPVIFHNDNDDLKQPAERESYALIINQQSLIQKRIYL
ncbi:hypothetical protein T05_13479 [Trichinella murrelli]|uniref:Uncharacterized protein n=1 Tax=Trichinella murrelli TaxID=144512 RepID=A0A0V0U9L4_9BILA|nr:hypothetical protein T05_13479 [Trichinella murrelli]